MALFLGFLGCVAMSELSTNLANSVYPGIDSDKSNYSWCNSCIDNNIVITH